MIQITTKQLDNGYYLTQMFINGKLSSSCRSLNREYTIKEENKVCGIVKRNLKK
jgi:hypothetical protein